MTSVLLFLVCLKKFRENLFHHPEWVQNDDNFEPGAFWEPPRPTALFGFKAAELLKPA